VIILLIHVIKTIYPALDKAIKNKEIYLAAMDMVDIAITNPKRPKKLGIAIWKKRSPVLSEDLATTNETMAAKNHGGAMRRKVTVVENPSVFVNAIQT